MLVIVVVGVVAVFGLKRGNLPSPGAAAPSTAGGAEAVISYGEIPQGERISMQTAQGVVSVKNFYKNVQQVDASASAIILASDPKYVLWYNRSDSSFEIALNQDFNAADGKNAKDNLLKILGITGQDLCKLKISVTVPYDNGQERSSRPPNFCPPAL